MDKQFEKWMREELEELSIYYSEGEILSIRNLEKEETKGQEKSEVEETLKAEGKVKAEEKLEAHDTLGVCEEENSERENSKKEKRVLLSRKQMEQFYLYYELLIKWNEVMNLTAITEMNQVVTKHFVDSLSLIKAVPDLDEKSYKIMDLGTGAGFPGIPLKIAFPNLKMTLLDSLNKRVKFLEEVISQLGLTEIEAVHGRAEDYGRDKVYREKYDICVSRAVANMATLSEYCMPFVKKEGYFIPYKSGKIEEELKQAKGAVKLLGGKMDEVISFQLPKTEAERTLVKIRKAENISKKYPRKAGLPGKEPLG